MGLSARRFLHQTKKGSLGTKDVNDEEFGEIFEKKIDRIIEVTTKEFDDLLELSMPTDKRDFLLKYSSFVDTVISKLISTKVSFVAEKMLEK